GEICWSSGVPTCLCVARRQVEGEQEGESQPEEAGRGKYFPPASPERVTAEVPERRDKGVHLYNA
ncbi:MAG: hypothetical protein ABID54_09740, partial [Pseudomonadota bacterium]